MEHQSLIWALSEGRTEISFSQPVTNPTILINFVHSNTIYFQFDPNMPTLVLVDSTTPVGPEDVPTSIGDNGFLNRVFIQSGAGNDTKDSGFAVRLTGTFSNIGFDTSPGDNGIDYQTVGLTVVATVPEPSSAFMIATAVAMMGFRRRRV